MAMHNPVGRANYEPNSHGLGPRENPETGFTSYPAEEGGAKRRIRAESFADHYSQARQFYISQTAIEQANIANALVFELSKCEIPEIRARVVSHLLNIDAGLAEEVATGLGLTDMPEAATPAKPVVETEPSPALSILAQPPGTFEGRKLGILVTDGIDGKHFDALKKAATEAGAQVVVIAKAVGGVETNRGRRIEADEKIDGAPSVLYDAVAVLASEDGAAMLAGMHPARTFLADAFAHGKFIALTAPAAAAFWPKAVPEEPDGGVFSLDDSGAASFVEACAGLRFWDRLA